MEGRQLLKEVRISDSDLTIQYHTTSDFRLEGTEGFFSFNFYLPKRLAKGSNIYIFGLMAYVYLCTRFAEFSNWNIIIYTDKSTYEKIQHEKQKEATPEERAALDAYFASGRLRPERIPLRGRTFELTGYNYATYPATMPFSENEKEIGFVLAQENILRPYKIFLAGKAHDIAATLAFQFKLLYYALFHSSRIIWAVCDWPSKEVEEKSINGFLMRCLRYRSPFDFPDQIHFIRDADTLMENYFTSHDPYLYIHSLAYALHIHETKSLAYLRNTETRLQKPVCIFGSIPGYLKSWHFNNIHRRQASIGFLAGYLLFSANVPCLTEALWSKCMGYINERVQKLPSGQFSNEEKGLVKWGRDEQILIFVIGPACIDSLRVVNVKMYADGTRYIIDAIAYTQFLNKTPLQQIQRKIETQPGYQKSPPGNVKNFPNIDYYVLSQNFGPSYSNRNVRRFEEFFQIHEDTEALEKYKRDLVKWGMLPAEGGGRARRNRSRTRKIVRKKHLGSSKK